LKKGWGKKGGETKWRNGEALAEIRYAGRPTGSRPQNPHRKKKKKAPQKTSIKLTQNRLLPPPCPKKTLARPDLHREEPSRKDRHHVGVEPKREKKNVKENPSKK